MTFDLPLCVSSLTDALAAYIESFQSKALKFSTTVRMPIAAIGADKAIKRITHAPFLAPPPKNILSDIINSTMPTEIAVSLNNSFFNLSVKTVNLSIIFLD